MVFFDTFGNVMQNGCFATEVGRRSNWRLTLPIGQNKSKTLVVIRPSPASKRNFSLGCMVVSWSKRNSFFSLAQDNAIHFMNEAYFGVGSNLIWKSVGLDDGTLSLNRLINSRGTKGSWGVVFPPRIGSIRLPDLFSFKSNNPSTSMVSGADVVFFAHLNGKRVSVKAVLAIRLLIKLRLRIDIFQTNSCRSNT